jgi:antigen flippase
MMRNLLAQQQGWAQVGLWQGVTSISDAYLQCDKLQIGIGDAGYALPQSDLRPALLLRQQVTHHYLARLDNKRDIAQEIGRALRFVLPAVAVASFAVWIWR